LGSKHGKLDSSAAFVEPLLSSPWPLRARRPPHPDTTSIDEKKDRLHPSLLMVIVIG
jgi:hypothetical protein